MDARNSKEVLRRSRDSVISWSDLQRCNTKHTPLRKITSCINFHSRFFNHCKILKSMKLKKIKNWKKIKRNKTSINNNRRIVLFVYSVILSLFQYLSISSFSDVCLLLFFSLCISICCEATFVFFSIKLFYFTVRFRMDLYDPLLLSLRLLRFHGFDVFCIPLASKKYCSPFVGFRRTFI